MIGVVESRAAARLGASVAGCAAGLGLVVTLVVQTLGTLPDAVMGPGQVAPVRPTFQAVEPRMLGAQRVGETQVVVQLPLFTPVDQAAQFGDRYGLGLEDSFPAFGKYVFNLPQISVQPGTQPGTAVIYFPAQASLADIHDYLTSNRLTVRRWYHVNDGGGQTPAKAALVLLPRVRLELVNAARGIWRATLPAHLDLARLNEWAAGVGIRIIRYDAGTGVVLIKGPAVARPASVTRVVRRVISRPAIATPKPRTVSPPAGFIFRPAAGRHGC